MKPKGFWSYARGDDDHLDKMLSDLRGAIAGEVSMLMGEDVGIFQDIHDLRTGDRWAETLRAGVSAASFLIPVLTPRFFNRDWCREEVLTYLRICEEAGIEPRIFPIRFVKWREDADCVVRQALQPFQYKDFSNWRFESDPTQKSRLVFEFAEDVTERLYLPQSGRKPAKASVGATHASQAQKTAEEINVPRKEETPPPKQTVHVVDPWPKRGDFTCIQAAIDKAEPGDRIVVREGTYRESLRLSKVLEIFGEGDRERILVTTDKGNALHCDAPLARIAGLRFRREPGGFDYAIWITAGGAEIEDCVVESQSQACISIKGRDSVPSLRRCLMRDGEQGGLFVNGGAQPNVEDCQFIGNTFAGVEVSGEASRTTLRRCIAAKGKQGGFYFQAGAGGLMESCEATDNGFSGVLISTGAAPVLRDCTLRQNSGSGLAIYKAGRGRVEGGRIEWNGAAGLHLQDGSETSMKDCTITGNASGAVLISDAESTGIFRNNNLQGNMRGAWDIAEGAKVERYGNME